MKKVILILTGILASLSAISQPGFTFSGKIAGGTDAYAIFMYTDKNGRSVKDSSVLKNGEFSFKGEISSPEMGYFTINRGSFDFKADDDPNTTSIFLEPGHLTAIGSYDHLKELKIKGSKSQGEFEELQKQYAGLTEEYKKLAHDFDSALADFKTAQKNNKSNKTIDSLHQKAEAIQNRYQNFLPRYLAVDRQFILLHPSSYVSAFQLKIDQNQWSYDSVKVLYDALNPNVRAGYDGREIKKKLIAIENNSQGKVANDFTTSDINGKPLSLSAFKGKVVLLDFWASWCVPCRASTPHLIELYKKYSSSGFDVIAIADDDRAKSAWAKAIEQDNSALWHNVLRGFHTGKESDDISTKFAVTALPTRILIDQNGIILARYTGTEDAAALDQKLAEVFKH